MALRGERCEQARHVTLRPCTADCIREFTKCGVLRHRDQLAGAIYEVTVESLERLRLVSSSYVSMSRWVHALLTIYC